MHREPKDEARWLFARVMERVDVAASMRETFRLDGRALRVGPHRIDLQCFRRIVLVAIGKAAIPMAQCAVQTLADALPLSGLVVGTEPWSAPTPLRYMQGDHPVPYQRSFAAADALLKVSAEADADTLMLYLISGGASALAEVPLAPSITPDNVSQLYEQLLYSGLSIEQTNVIRKHFSAIKGGRLALAAGAASRCTLLISDVPPARLDVVGSGPSLADSSSVQECRRLLQQTAWQKPLPASVWNFAAVMPETPKVLPEGRLPPVALSLLSSESLTGAAQSLLTAEGYRVVVDNTCDDWDYREAADYLVSLAQQEASGNLPLCIVSAGEVTVTVHGQSGVGGRNQQWALEVARLIRDMPGWLAMSVGSDGIDGNSLAAGAVVDGLTWARAEQAGFHPQQALDTFDTYPLFHGLQDVVAPGPSGNNLRDLRVIFVHSPSSRSENTA